MKSKVVTLKTGVRSYLDSSGVAHNECLNCGSWFKPKRKLSAKYCSHSCKNIYNAKIKTQSDSSSKGQEDKPKQEEEKPNKSKSGWQKNGTFVRTGQEWAIDEDTGQSYILNRNE